MNGDAEPTVFGLCHLLEGDSQRLGFRSQGRSSKRRHCQKKRQWGEQKLEERIATNAAKECDPEGLSVCGGEGELLIARAVLGEESFDGLCWIAP